ncbi:MAG TPA: TonB-dependent receptor plug domain-containing protein [Thermoanaerobaculia bacterium]|nr:TonB-dependent receptor plug domain-containing protein [Thermoanaerobaculia bacterium]
MSFASLLVTLALAAGMAQPAEPPAAAAEAAEPAGTVEERIVVVAPPIVEESRYDPHAGLVAEVGARQIEDLAAQDLAAALRRVPGVVISRYNPVGSYGGGDGGALFVRGVGTGRPGAELTTRVDGVARFVGVWTHPLLDLVGIDGADRIDVYRGPQPVLFGGMSFATVDLVPHRRHQEGIETRIGAAGGSHGTSAFTLRHAGRSGARDWTVAGGARESDGHREGADGRTRSLLARAGYELGSGWSVGLTLDAAAGRASDPGIQGSAPLPVRPRFETEGVLGILTLARRHGEGERARQGTLKLHFDDGAIDWRQWDGARGQAFTTLTDWTNYGLRLEDRFAVGARGDLTLGFEAERYGGRSREERPAGVVPLGDFRFGNTALFAGYAHTFGERVRFVPSAGVRYNESRDFGGDWGGQLALRVEGRAGEAWVRAARAFNLPGVWAAVFYEGYGRGGQYRDLGPELLDHLELGAARSFGEGLRVELSLFRNEVTDALRFLPPPPPPPRWGNVGDYTAEGAELSLAARPLAGLSLFLGLTWTRTAPENVPYAPEWTGSAGLVWARGPWRLSLDLQHLSAREAGNLRFPGAPARLDAFLLANGRIAYRFAGSGLELYLAGENLGDAGYEYRPGYPMPGANLLSGVTWSF